ncbi:DUF397 domain-containing protein [Streptomyces sp. S1D4-20]|uniref:DUF397 domain-containing protein n=1 Tax=Streptomyces sp. S1D4-20 TaxID=2594462 RepID=UPI0011637899|nr:DUF397 domain-containing protein [Streptomyces sp. S1D4-20]QDN54257.1 DUF397 domain-containing protein [Streptomyces sp. S1D4-20]
MSHVKHANSELGAGQWRKPWSGSNGGNCVEAKKLSNGEVALRQSTDPDGPALICSPQAINDFIAAAKNGKTDFLLA